MKDIRFAFRQLFKNPGSTAVIVLTLALVIGTLCLALGVVQHERAAWVPFPEADRMVRLWKVGKERPISDFRAATFAELQRQVRQLESIGAIGLYRPYVITGRGEPRSVIGLEVSSSVFQIAGITPLLGRTFTADEESAGAGDVVVISHRLWQEAFHSDPAVVGQAVNLGERPRMIVGVMPNWADRNALFYGMDVWLCGRFESPSQEQALVGIVGRLKQGVSLAELRAELNVVGSAIKQAYGPLDSGRDSSVHISAYPVGEDFSRSEIGSVVAATVIPAFVVLIACFNIANILLARMAARRREIAVRSALGARRVVLLRQLLTEGVMLAVCGGLLGVVGAVWVSTWAAAHDIPAQFSLAVLAFVFAVTAGIGVAVSLPPAFRATRGDLVSDLKEGGGSASGGIERHRLRNFLLTGQVTMAMVLCVAAALLVRSYINKKRFVPEFETKNLIYVAVSPNRTTYDTPQKRLLYCEQVMERLRAVPGLDEISVASTTPIDRHPFPMGFYLEGDGAEWKREQTVKISIVSPSYQSMASMRVRRGRVLAEGDHRGAEPVMLVNESFVERFFPNTDPIGRQVGLNIEAALQWVTIVGVVPDRRNLGFEEHLGPEAFVSYRQAAPEWVSYFFLVRTRGTSAALNAAVREAVRSVDLNQPVSQATSVAGRLEWAVRRNIEGMRAIAAIGLFGLIMAAIGIYGVVSYSVVERTHEIGVRMALGAEKSAVLRLILRQAMKLTVIGLAIGSLLGFAVSFGISELLFGVRAFDPATYVLVGGVLLAAALVASWLPALRATKVDPIEALRCE